MNTPKGFVAILTSPNGHVMATATDFEPTSPGGMALEEAQSHRALNLLGLKMIENLCHTDILRIIRPHQASQMMREMQDTLGYQITTEAIGHSDISCGTCKITRASDFTEVSEPPKHR